VDRRRRLEEIKRREIMQGAHRESPVPPGEEPDALLHHLRQGLATLGRDERTLLVLRYETGLALVEIANILGCSEATVRRQLVRALQQLREVMDEASGHA
jgi:RNA polymerase sigma factor (sigma-70 family)